MTSKVTYGAAVAFDEKAYMAGQPAWCPTVVTSIGPMPIHVTPVGDRTYPVHEDALLVAQQYVTANHAHPTEAQLLRFIARAVLYAEGNNGIDSRELAAQGTDYQRRADALDLLNQEELNP